MNFKKNNKIILLVLIIITIISFSFLFFNNSKTTLNKRETEFAIDDTSLVTKVFIADKQGNSVKLIKQTNGSWLLNDKYEANSDIVGLLLYTAKNIQVSSIVPKTAHNNIIKRMSSASTKVEIYENSYRIKFFGLKLFPYEKKSKTYYIGDATMDNMANFMMLEGSKRVYIVNLPGFRGYVSTRYSFIESDWRDHTVFRTKLNQIKELKVEHIKNPEQSYKVESVGVRKFNLYRLSNNSKIESYDTAKLIDNLMLYRSLKYEASANNIDNKSKDSIINFNHFLTITLTEKEGKITKVRMFYRPELVVQNPDETSKIELNFSREKFYSIINDSKDFNICQFYVFERILQPLDYFLIKQNK